MTRFPLLGLLLLGAAVLPLTGLAPAPSSPEHASGHAAADGARVVLVVRHAETQSDGTSDPPLSAAGTARAVTLARIAAAHDVETVLATPFRRLSSRRRSVRE